MKNIYKINGLRIQFGRLPAGLPALLFIIAALFATPVSTSAQSGLCDPTVPFFTVDLTASPNATWTSPVIVRTDNCCGTTSPDRCLEFEITVNPGTIAINFNIASGAVPPGAMFYQINCGPPVAVGTPICLTGTGPFTLTFCKPGNNPNTYAVTAIPEPTVGPPVYASSTCPASIWVQGLVPGTITWTDVTGGGIYNSYLSCTTCASPVVTPAAGHPAYVDYVVCGTIAAGACSGSSSFCDTVRVYMFDPIDAVVNPNPAYFCPSDPGVQLNGSHSGGYGTVVYTWYNSSWTQVGTGNGYFATSAGTYYLVVTDDMSAVCPADTVPVTVNVYDPPILVSPSYAGICEGSSVTLTASGADSYVWAPTTGLSPATGSVVTAAPATTTTYTVTGTDSHGCTGSMTVLIDIFPLPNIDAGPDQEICIGESAQLQGSGAFSYEWTPAATLSNPNISNPIATPATTTTYYLTGYSIGGNLIYNGDFELGNTGFTTDYIYDPNLFPEGNYYITNNPNTHHSNFAPCADHTPAPGSQMMVVNGAPNANEQIWCMNVAVIPNTDYAFSTWITSVHPTNPAVLQFSINSILLGSPFTATSTTCDWQQFYEIWNSGTNTSAQICIVNQNIIRNGNDFALDDIGFAPLCSNIDSVTVTVNPNPILTITATNPDICTGNSTTLSASSDIPGTTYVWSNGATINSITVSPASTSTYFVTGTSANGCTGTASIEIIVNPLPVISVAASDANICVGENSVLTATSDIPGSSFLWSTGANTASITVSPAATTTYNVTVTSPEGCVSTGEVTVNVFPNPVLTITASSGAICFGDPSVISVSSSIAATTFEWSTGETTANITVSPASTSTYFITGTSANGCTGTASIEIIVNPLPVISVAASDANICVGENSVLTATSDIPGSSFLWSNGANTASITVSPAATTTYNVTVTSPEGCVSTGEVTVNVFPNPVLTITASSGAICFGDPSVISVSSSIAATTFEWSTGETTANITVSPASTSTYFITGTSANGCTGTASIEIIVNPLPVISVAASDANICVGENSVLTATSDIPGSSFLWSNGANTASITVSPAATTTYNVTVTSPEGCVSTGEVTVNVFPNPVLTITASSGAICFGDPSVISVSSSIAATIFEWSTGETTANITVSPASTSTYFVTGTSANGCTGTASIEIIVNPLPVISVAASDANICVGENSVLTATSDIPGSSFLWSNGANTASITVSPAATTTYNVTVTSPEGCVSTGEVTVNVFPNPVLTITASSGAICFGDPSVISVSSSIAATTFEWSTGETTANITVSPASTSTYFVTGTSANGCTGTASIEIIVNPLPVISVAASDANICVGENSVLTATSDIPGSSFLWSTGANTASITVSPAATTTYNVTVTSPEGCVSTGEVTVNVFPNPVLTITASSGAICFGDPSVISVSSSIAATTFEWSTGETTANITVSPASTSTYFITGTSANGCTGTASIEIIVNPLPVISVAASDANICVGENSVLTATSDIPGSSFLWSNGANTASITVSPAATTTYNVTVTSPEGCVSTGEVTVNVFPNPVLTITASDMEICNGASATINASSTISGTAFEWNTGSTNSSITVGPNTTTTYSITGTAANGCIGTTNIEIIVNPLPTITTTVTDSIICDGESVTLTAFSDITGSTYQWSTGASTPEIIVAPNLTNTYYLTVTSPEGCVSTANSTITVNPNPIASIVPSSGAICMGSTATLTANSNIAVNSYLWNTAETNPSIIVTPATTSTYTVTLTTAEGCSGTADISVFVNPLPDISVTAPAAAICIGSSLDLTANSNHPSTGYEWSTGQTTPSINVSPAASSTYSVTGTDINGCTGEAEFIVTVNPLPDINIVSAQNEICEGMSVELTATSNIPDTDFEWNTGQTSSSIIVSPPASTTYEVTGTDANGCTGSNRITIQVNPNPTVTINPNSLTICPGDTATLNASSAMAITYAWNTGATTTSISVWPSNTSSYSVTGTDINGCIGIAAATVVVRNAPVIVVSPYNPKICYGDSVTLIASGAVLYDWTPATGLNTNVGHIVTSSPDSTTTYIVAGVDLYGCQGSTNVTVTVHPIPTVDFRADETDICQATVVHFSGMASPSIQSWEWDFGDPASGASNSSSMQNPMHAFFETGTYTIGLSVVTTAGCKNSIQKPSYIIVHPNPIASFARTPDITTLEYPTIQFYDQSLGEKSRLWDFDDPGSGLDNNSIAKNPTHTYSASGEYWATLFVENEWGCLDSVSNRIIINPTWDEYIPSAFSPNGDGNNDVFRPMGFNIDFTQYQMYIYDRWGKEIFDTDNIEEGWDGRVNDHGETVQQDVYVYLIILTDISGLEHQFIGHVTVVK